MRRYVQFILHRYVHILFLRGINIIVIRWRERLRVAVDIVHTTDVVNAVAWLHMYVHI